MPQSSIATSMFVVFCSMFVMSCSSSSADSLPGEPNAPLELLELQRWDVEALGEISVAALSDNGGIALALVGDTVGWLNRSTGQLERILAVSALGIAIDREEGLRVLSDEGCELVLSRKAVKPDTHCLKTPTNARPVGALFSAPTFSWIEQRLVDDSLRLRRRSDGQLLWTDVSIDSGAGQMNSLPHLASGGEGSEVVEWSSALPLTARIWNAEAEMSRRWQVDISALSLGDSSKWRVLRPVWLGSRWLLVIADLHSDRRAIVLISNEGELIRHKLVETPIGFLAANSVGQILAVSEVGRRELVLYCWSSSQPRDATSGQTSHCSP